MDTSILAFMSQIGCVQFIDTLGEKRLVILTELQQARPDCAA